jgi:predicted GNAT family acetyltransferase
MGHEERQNFDTVKLLNIEAEAPYDWEIQDANHIRVCLPATEKNQLEMHRRGFFHADRLINTSINLAKSKVDYHKLLRMEVIKTLQYRERIKEIAVKSFPADRRFHVGIRCDMSIAVPIISQRIETLEECLVCMYHENPVGFLELREIQAGKCYVNLAAVEERYRTTGAAVSLYAKAALECKDNGFRTLDGCISTNNTAVMNLYSFLGASFLNPVDVFLKEVGKCALN